MSFYEYRDTIQEGDVVLLYLGHYSLYPLTVKKGKIAQTKRGAVWHDNLIGTKFGRKVNTSKGWVHVLHPTPELWTLALPHRTQILYSTDIAMVNLLLDLKPGSIVIESGTGSGSLSHALVRAVAPTGHLHTFDFHAQRVEVAEKEFKQHGIGDFVTVKQADACKDGFGLEHVADAVFLDLPMPWEAVPKAKQALKKAGGRLCSFSPCIEQVQRTCKALNENGFKDMKTIECLLRTFRVQSINMPICDLEAGWPQGQSQAEPKKDTDEEGQGERETSEGVSESEGGSQAKKVKGDGDSAKAADSAAVSDSSKVISSRQQQGEKDTMLSFKCPVPTATIPGHTGYLTFATLPPQLRDV